MRGSDLHAALRHLTVEAGRLLTRELENGAELPFEVLEEGDGRVGPGPVLYRYRPLTPRFIAERWEKLRELDAYAEARVALGSGAGPYLRHRGLAATGPDDALREILERLFEDATTFDLREGRFERVRAELEATLEDSTVVATVLAPVHGVRLASPRVELGDGLALIRRAGLTAPPSALEGALRAPESTAEAAGEAGSAEPSPLDVFSVLRRELPIDAPLPVDEARAHFRRVLTALRLCGAGGTALGPLAWARAGDGAWHPVALGVSARARPESWELREPEESELRELLEILSRSRHSAGVAWALARFEMGCERALETEALSDYMLGIRALVGDGAEGGEERAAERLAALCAPEDERDVVRDRARRAFALERKVVQGHGEGGSALALDSPRTLVREVEQHVRALLRDVLCGYLDEDLRQIAAEIRGSSGPPDAGGPIHVRDVRAGADEDTTELEAVGAAVTPSVDWD